MNFRLIISKRYLGFVATVTTILFMTMVISRNQQSFTDHVVQFKAVSTYHFDNSNVVVSTDMPPRLKYSTESIPLLSHGSDLPTNHSDAMTAELQLKSLREAYASVHTGIDEIKVLKQDPNGQIHNANDEDANAFRRQLLKSMNVDSSIIDDYIDSRDVELQPELAEWEHLPGQLKKYAPFLFKLVPKEKNAHFKTPCWYRQGSLKCLPYFYILGMTKCGTSDLWNKTTLHPQIIGTPKETHWWTHRFGKNEAVSSNKQVGKFLFKYTMRALSGIDMPNPSQGKTNSTKVLGDGSPSTLWNNKSWRRVYPRLKEPPYVNADVIAALTPGVKLIIILRDPVERLYSSYNFFNRNNKRSPETFHDLAQNSVEFFEACMTRGGSLRGCTYQSSIMTQVGDFHTEFTGGLYYVYLKDWFRAFPKEQILILELSDWHINCEENLSRVYKLLDLDPSSGEIVRQSCNQPTRVRTYKTMPRPMLNETRRYLQQKYKPFNKMLYELLEDDKFYWKYNK